MWSKESLLLLDRVHTGEPSRPRGTVCLQAHVKYFIQTHSSTSRTRVCVPPNILPPCLHAVFLRSSPPPLAPPTSGRLPPLRRLELSAFVCTRRFCRRTLPEMMPARLSGLSWLFLIRLVGLDQDGKPVQGLSDLPPSHFHLIGNNNNQTNNNHRRCSDCYQALQNLPDWSTHSQLLWCEPVWEGLSQRSIRRQHGSSTAA